jgi:hypothetical protein
MHIEIRERGLAVAHTREGSTAEREHVPLPAGRLTPHADMYVEPRLPSVLRLIPAGGLGRTEGRLQREQLLRFEIDANNGVYAKPAEARLPGESAALEDKGDLHQAHPLYFAEIPLGGKDKVKFFHAAGDASSQALVHQMIRANGDPIAGNGERFAYLPIHWEEVGTFREKFPHIRVIADGEVRRGASARSLFIGTEEGQAPARFDLEDFSLKLHLSHDNYQRMGGLGGERDIRGIDAWIATITNHVVHKLRPTLSRYLEIQPEATAQVALLQGRNGPEEIGAIYRSVPDPRFVPGFSMFSPTLERLPHVPPGAIRGIDLEEGTGPKRILARDAIRYAREKASARGENWSRVETFKRLFVEPLLDVYFSLAKHGFSTDLHSQNFGFKFDPETGLTERVTLRDLHGVNYNRGYARQHGLPDLYSPKELAEAFPDITQADLDGFFDRPGRQKPHYQSPQSFQTTLDFFLGQFFYNVLNSLKADKTFDSQRLAEAIEAIKDTTEEKAREHGFDLRPLVQPNPTTLADFDAAEKTGLAGRILFRRALAASRPLPAQPADPPRVSGIRVERMIRDGNGSRVYTVAAEHSPLHVASFLKVTHGGSAHADRIIRVAETLRASPELRERFGAIIPRTIRVAPDAVLQEGGSGLTWEELTPEARKRAEAERRAATLLAADIFPEVYSTWRGNFLYRPNGELSAWFDLISDGAKAYVRAGLPTPDNLDDGGALRGGIDGLNLPPAPAYQGRPDVQFYRAVPARGGEVGVVVFNGEAKGHALATLEALQRLEGVSPHVPKLIAHDAKNDTIRIAMQVGRVPLTALPPQPTDEMVRLLASLARTLDKAHAAGVTHRALKAEHVIVNPTDPSGRYLLVGWGESVTAPFGPVDGTQDLKDLARMALALVAPSSANTQLQGVLEKAANGKYASGAALAAALERAHG